MWFAENPSVFGDVPDAVRDAYLECFQDNGIDMPKSTHITDIYRILDEDRQLNRACADASSR